MAYQVGSGAVIKMGVDGADQATKDIGTVGDALRQLDSTSLGAVTSQLGSLVAIATAAVTAFLGFDAVVTGVNESIDRLAALDDAAQKTGSSIVGSLSRIQKVAMMTGTDFGVIDKAVFNMAKTMGSAGKEGDKTRAALAAIGITQKDIASQDTAALFIQIAKSLQGYNDNAGKSATLNQIFGKSAEELAPFLNDVAESVDQFGGRSEESAAMASKLQDNLGLMKTRASEFYDVIAEAVLPVLATFTGQLAEGSSVTQTFKGYLDELAKSGQLKAWAEGAATAVKFLFEMIVPAAKVAATYFAVFVAGPAIFAAVTAATSKLVAAVAVYTMNVLIGQAATIKWNTALFGTAMAANTAAGGLFTLKTAGSALVAAVAGWQFGSWLRDSFVQARVAGLLFVGALLKGFENLVFAGKAYAAVLSQLIPGSESLSVQLSRLNGEREAAIAAINENIDGLASYELWENKATAADAKAVETKTDIIAANTEQADAVAAAIKSAKDYIASLQTERAQIGLTAGQIRMMAAGKEALKAPTAALRLQIISEAAALVQATDAWEAKVEAEKKAGEVQKKFDDGAAGAWEQVRALEAQIEMYDKVGIAAINVERTKVQAKLNGVELSAQETAALESQLAALDRQLQLQGKLDALDAGKAGRAKLKEFLDPAKAQTFGEALKTAFGVAGDSLSKMVGLMQVLTIQEEERAKLTKAAKDASLDDEAKFAQEMSRVNEKLGRERIGTYADMAGAAKGFFRENTAGYKILEGAERAYRAFEMAMAVKSMVEKSGLLTAFTALFVTSKATQTAAEVAATGPSIAAAGAQASAWGITAVVKAIASMPFPANILAGAATLAAVVAIGAKVAGSLGGGSSGGGQSAEDAQRSQATGSVFGDMSAQSDSIGKSIELLKANSDTMVPINRGMLAALKNIESSIGGLSNILVRTPGVVDGSNFGIATGQLNIGQATDGISSIMTKVTNTLFLGFGDKISSFINNLWGKTKQDIVDSGLQFGGSLRGLQSGQGFNQYASVDTTKSSWFGAVKKTTNRVEEQGVSPELASQFGKVFTGLEGYLSSAAASLGIKANKVKEAFDSLVIDPTKVSLKGLTGEALTDAVSGVISKTMDQISEVVFPEMDAFRRVGEGYAETVVRLASNYATLDNVLASIGTSFGSTGVASLAARERLIEMSGGIETLAAQANGFAERYLTEAERLAPVAKYVTEEMARLGLSSVTTRDQFKTTVLGLDKYTEAGAEQFAALMALEEAFAQVYPAIEKVTEASGATGAAAMTTAQILTQEKELRSQLSAITSTSADLERNRAAAINSANKELFDSLVAAEKADVIAKQRAVLSRELLVLSMSEADLLEEKRLAYDESLRMMFDEAEVKRKSIAAAKELQAVNDGWLKQLKDFERAGMTAAQLKEDDVRDMDATTRAIYDLFEARKLERSAIEAAAASIANMAALLKNGLAILADGANDAMKAVSAAVASGKAEAQAEYDARIAILKAQESAVRSANAADVKRIKDAQATTKSAHDAAIKQIDAEKKAADVAYDKAVDAVKLQVKAMEAAHDAAMDNIKQRAEAENALYKSASDALKAAGQVANEAYKTASNAIKDERNAAVKARAAASKVQEDQIKNQSRVVADLASSTEMLQSTLSSMQMEGQEGAARASAQEDIRGMIATMRAGGAAPDNKLLAAALRTLSKPSENLASSFADYQQDYQMTANDIATLSRLTGRQVDEAETQLAVLESARDQAVLQHEALLLKLDQQQEALDANNELRKAAAEAEQAALELRHADIMDALDAERSALEASAALQREAFEKQLAAMAAAQESLIAALDKRKEVLDANYGSTMAGFEDELSRLSDQLAASLAGIDADRNEAAGVLEGKLKVFDDILIQAQKDFDIQMGTYNALKDLPEALRSLSAALAALGRGQDVVNGPAAGAQASTLAEQIVNGITAKGGYAKVLADQEALIAKYGPTLDEIAKANDMYRSVLGRDAEGNSAAALAASIKGGTSESTALSWLSGSVEAQARAISEALQRQVNKLVNTALGTGIDSEKLFDGSHANGLDSVPYDGYIAQLHRGEMVLPANVAQSVRGGSSGGLNGAEVIAALNRIQKEIVDLRESNSEENFSIAKHTGRGSDVLEEAAAGQRPLITAAEEEETV